MLNNEVIFFWECIDQFFGLLIDPGGMITILRAFIEDETAATAIEYALIAGGLSIVIVAAVNSVGTSLNSIFGNVSSQLN